MDTTLVTSHPELGKGLRVLTRRDGDLRRIVRLFGPPPVWARKPGFSTLVHIILEQQVSLASARATYEKLKAQVSRLTPRQFLSLDGGTLKECGFSRQKASYCRELAESIVGRRVVLRRLRDVEDHTVKSQLVQIKGIGPWSADIYLLMVLLRPDIWPSGDLALASAARRAKGLRSVPSPEQLEAMGEAWRPWRAVAARILWHFYLSEQALTAAAKRGYG